MGGLRGRGGAPPFSVGDGETPAGVVDGTGGDGLGARSGGSRGVRTRGPTQTSF